MLNLNQFTAIADSDGVQVPTVERDYVMSHVIAMLADQPVSAHLEFKGGTALRLCHFEEYRYSADIDFNITDEIKPADALEGLSRALAETKDSMGITHLELSEDAQNIEFVASRRQQNPDRIKLDISDDELLEATGSRVPVILRYEDQVVSEGLPTYSLTELASEKLRCILQRLQCRDAYDLHRILCDSDLEISEVWPRFEVKARHKSVDPSSFKSRFDRRMDQYRTRWEDEMSGYTADYPPFDRLERELRRALRD